MSSNNYSSSAAKSTQNKIIVMAILGICVFIVLIVFATDNKPKQIPKQNKVTDINASVTNNVSEQQVYLQKTQNDIAANAAQISDLQGKFKALQDAESVHIKVLTDQMTQNFAKINSQLEDMKKNPQLPPASSSLNLPLPPTKLSSKIEESSLPEVQDSGIISVDVDKSNASGVVSSSNSLNAKNTNKTMLPISFVKARLITSIDAPTGGTSQDNPFPILLNVTDNAQLPGKLRTKTKGCFVLAAGYGDVASERAYFRTVGMSCATKNGELVNLKVAGYIAGEDGKAGLRGRLVSKTGSKIVLALLSGSVGGLAQAFAQTATTLQQTPIGPTQTITPTQSLGYAGATGVSSGFQQLSQYYINMAEKTFPVIEINDQRNVTVIFTEPVEFPLDMNKNDDKKSLPISVD
jgi:conjugal transfer pilus assembly protein TraB